MALSTSKLNYLDPRISVAWCKRFGVPIEKVSRVVDVVVTPLVDSPNVSQVYNATQRKKFRWAIEMTKDDYVF